MIPWGVPDWYQRASVAMPGNVNELHKPHNKNSFNSVIEMTFNLDNVKFNLYEKPKAYLIMDRMEL